MSTCEVNFTENKRFFRIHSGYFTNIKPKWYIRTWPRVCSSANDFFFDFAEVILQSNFHLTYSFPMHPFSIPRKHQKTVVLTYGFNVMKIIMKTHWQVFLKPLWNNTCQRVSLWQAAWDFHVFIFFFFRIVYSYICKVATRIYENCC